MTTNQPANQLTNHPITVAIMAGGKSSRMGRDKAFVPFNGRPLIETVLRQVAGLGTETILITNKPEPFRYFGLPMFADVVPDCGPLGGIYTAVHHAAHPHTLVVACDMPWLNRDLLKHMLTLREEADIIVPRWTQFPEPLHAIYHKNCLPPIKSHLQAGQFKIVRFYNQVKVRYVDRVEIEPWDGDGRSFANINTPQQLDDAQKQTGPA
ncbi:MAG: molybdenum cofactor guanylyltransferase [Anaerolineae bacterium]